MHFWPQNVQISPKNIFLAVFEVAGGSFELPQAESRSQLCLNQIGITLYICDLNKFLCLRANKHIYFEDRVL